MPGRLGRPSVLVIIGGVVIVAAAVGRVVPMPMALIAPLLLLTDAVVNGERSGDRVDMHGIRIGRRVTPWDQILEVTLGAAGSVQISTADGKGGRQRTTLTVDPQGREKVADRCRFHGIPVRHQL